MDDIAVEVLHPLPVAWTARGGSGRLGLADVPTPVRLRAVPAGSLEPLAFPGRPDLDGFAHGGRYWRGLLAGTGPRRGGPATPLDAGLRALRGGTSARRGHAGCPLMAHQPPGTLAPLPRRGAVPAGEAVPGLLDDARARLRAFFERDVVHDGAHVYVAWPAPVLVGSTLGEGPDGSPATRVRAMPGELKGVGPVIRLDRAGAAAAFRLAQNRRPSPVPAAAAAAVLETLAGAGIACDDADVSSFLHQAPALLAQVGGYAPRLPRLATPPGHDEATAGRVSALGPWIARGLVGAIDEADHAAVAGLVHGLARDLMEAHYPGGVDHRPTGGPAVYLRWILRYVETVVRPRLAEREAALDPGDAAALAGLAPGRPA